MNAADPPADFESRLQALEAQLKVNTDMTRVNTEMTRDVHEVLMMARSGIAAIGKFGRGLATVGRWLTKFFKWATPIAVGVVAIYHAVMSFLHLK